MEYDDFEYLQDKKVIEQWSDYYKDLRWASDQVNHKYQLLLKLVSEKKNIKGQPVSVEQKLLNILTKAKETGTGVIAYCD